MNDVQNRALHAFTYEMSKAYDTYTGTMVLIERHYDQERREAATLLQNRIKDARDSLRQNFEDAKDE